MTPRKCVAYYRVSTAKQGQSGLGLDAQRRAVNSFIAAQDRVLLSEFVEVESGRKASRPQLAEAIRLCKKANATLIIARLDRLARSVHFISGLMESGVDFVATDMPTADRFMLHVYAAMAEEEARRTSHRTKAALAAAQARGVRLGENGARLAQKHRQAANQFAEGMRVTIECYRREGCVGVRHIALRLNSEGFPTSSGGPWHPTTVSRLLARLAY